MSLRTDPLARFVLLAMLLALLAATMACAPDRSRLADLGRVRFRVVPPPGWEHLDHGRQHLFRDGETELALTDLGAATPEGVADELREAAALWHAGRREDALARVRATDGAPLRCLSREARADFWRAWRNAGFEPDPARDDEVGAALEELIRDAAALPEPSASQVMAFALERYSDTDRREIGYKRVRWVNGSEWLAFETWDRVSHSYRRSYACLEAQGRLVLLSAERGHDSRTEPAFDELFASLEFSPDR